MIESLKLVLEEEDFHQSEEEDSHQYEDEDDQQNEKQETVEEDNPSENGEGQ